MRRLTILNGGIPASRVVRLASVVRSRTQGCSQPSRVSCSFKPSGARRRDAIEIDRQQLADRRALIPAFGERLEPAQHQKAAAALADELLQQRHLFLRKELRFDVVEDHRVVGEQRSADLGNRSQFLLVSVPKPQQHRLVVLFGVSSP